MTEQELISRLQALKQVKPRESWVIFAKNEIFSNEQTSQPKVRTNYAILFGGIFKATFLNNFAYSMAIFLFIITVGFFAVTKGVLPNNSSLNLGQNSTASLVAIKDNVEEFKIKSKTLSTLNGRDYEDVSLAMKEVEEMAKELTVAIKKDPELAKAVALDINNNKTYLEVVGGSDLKATSDVLYKTIVEQMIKDLENTTLTKSHQKSLGVVVNLYNEEKYASALESILLLSSAVSETN